MGVLLIGCALVLLVVGCSGVRSGASKKEKGHSPEATASKEEARCQGTRTYHYHTKDPQVVLVATTNDIPGCPKGGLLLGTDKRDFLNGKEGDDVIRGLGGTDNLSGGSGNDKIYAGPDGSYEVIGEKGDDVLYAGPDGAGLVGGPGEDVLYGGTGNDGGDGGPGNDILYGGPGNDRLVAGKGEDVLYGGDGNDFLDGSNEGRDGSSDGQRDKIYCGAGKDHYYADKKDYVDSSCEKQIKVGPGGPGPPG